jgi:hypothetical protein
MAIDLLTTGAGHDPATSTFKEWRSACLSYPAMMDGDGIEPPSPGLQPGARPSQLTVRKLPARLELASTGLGNLRLLRSATAAKKMVESMGLEPIHRVCRTRMPPTTSTPQVWMRGLEPLIS